MTPVPIVFHPDYRASMKPGHRFPMSKYAYLRDVLVTRGLLPIEGGYHLAEPVSLDQAARAHARDYVERVASVTLNAEETRRIGLPNSPAVSRRAFLSSGGTLMAAYLAFDHGLACNMAGGSHHADPDGGAGFCVFNDVAIAAHALLAEGRATRILVVDCDVHQGDGTARIFQKDPRVFTLSLHAEKNYPARKAQSDLDFPLPDGLQDAAYLEVLDHALAQTDRLSPDLVFYNAGVDPYEHDKLGRLALSLEGLRRREARVIDWARRRRIPLVGVLGGGYDDDALRLAERHAILFEEAAQRAVP